MILKYKQFNENIEFKDKSWIDVNLLDIDDIVGNYIWNMYKNTYSKQKLDFSAYDWNELKNKYKATFLIDVDNDQIPDAFIIYRNTKFGNKLALLATNGKREAKRKIINKVFELLHSSGWYIEASRRMEEILSKTDINVITNNRDILNIIPKASSIDDAGYYQRFLSKVDKVIVKRLYGNPILNNS